VKRGIKLENGVNAKKEQWQSRAKRLGREGGDVRAHMQQGIAYMKNQQYDEALAEFDAVLRVNPNIAQAHLAIGNTQYKRGQLERAMECYQRALSIDQQLAPAMFMTGTINMEMGDTDRALEDFEAALGIDPDLVRAQLGVGRIYEQQKRFDEAERQVKEILRRNPELTTARIFLAKIYRQKDDLPAAIVELKEAVKTDPNFWMSYLLLGSIYLKQKEYAQALDALQKIIENKPDSAIGYFLLGVCTRALSDYEAAEGAFMEAGRLSPRQMHSIKYQLAKTYLGQGRYAEARDALLALAQTKHRSAAVQQLLGDVYFCLEHYKQAVEEYEATLLHSPSLAEKHPQLTEIAKRDVNDELKATAFRDAFANISVPFAERGQRGGDDRRTSMRLRRHRQRQT
jgi:tetratricopeptide (TPR) repeat protein